MQCRKRDVDSIAGVMQHSSPLEAATGTMSYCPTSSVATAYSITENNFDWFDENFEPFTSSDSDNNYVEDGTLSEKHYA